MEFIKVMVYYCTFIDVSSLSGGSDGRINKFAINSVDGNSVDTILEETIIFVR